MSAIVRACTADRARRDVATSRDGAVALFFARRFPALADRLVARQPRRALRRGAMAQSPLAARAREHMPR